MKDQKTFFEVSRDSLAVSCVMWIIIYNLGTHFLHRRVNALPYNPKYFDAEVVTQEDYLKLSRSGARTVELSNGVIINKNESWDFDILPKYKSVNNNSQYVLVKFKDQIYTKFDFWLIVGPIFLNSLLVLVYQLVGWGLRKRRVQVGASP
jgi:hypothetical protein